MHRKSSRVYGFKGIFQDGYGFKFNFLPSVDMDLPVF